jgi:diguanylate cyclase (GGDEF)-like protein
MISYLADSLVYGGLILLVGSLFPVRRLMGCLPKGPLRNRWYALTVLIMAFIGAYLVYAVAFRASQQVLRDLIVPAVFFLGACFVLLTALLSLKTALALQRIPLLEQENITDPLTGIYNRRHLKTRLQEEVERATRYGLPISVFFFDIDRFKQLNDHYGHQAGDLVLASLAMTLTSLRTSDIASRYGGEEFCVVLPNTTLTGALDMAEHLRKNIEAHEFDIPFGTQGRQKVFITVSIGVASLGSAADTAEKLIQAADEALYRAKSQGRNCVAASRPDTGETG